MGESIFFVECVVILFIKKVASRGKFGMVEGRQVLILLCFCLEVGWVFIFFWSVIKFLIKCEIQVRLVFFNLCFLEYQVLWDSNKYQYEGKLKKKYDFLVS